MKLHKYFYKNELDLKRMRYAGKVAFLIKKELQKMILVNNNGLMLAKKAHQIMKEHNCQPSFLNYYGFPNVICVSINEQLIHGIPNDLPFKENDLITIDIGCKYQGVHVDCATSFIVGKGDKETHNLLETTKKALKLVEENLKPFSKTKEVAKIIEQFITSKGYFLTPLYCGHGIGKKLHEKPNIYNIYYEENNFVLAPKMTFCVEPMVLIGSPNTKILNDKWTVISENKKRTCHFEDTFLMTKNGIENLTSPKE